MNKHYIKYFLKCGYLNNLIIYIISNYSKKINTIELDYICLYFINKVNCKSSTINYENYKFSSCISFENIICHGIPLYKNIKYKYLKIDISIIYNKLHSDSCYNNNFLYIKKNYFLKNIFYNIVKKTKKKIYFFNKKIEKLKIFLNEEYCSHGIFKKLHNNLIIFHNKNKIKIKNLDSFTLEPMFIFKNKKGYHFKNIYLTIKNNLSFQWEHTLYILRDKIITTTLRKNELCFIQQ